MNNEQLWQAVLGEMELNISRANFSTWFKQTYISSFDDGVIIVCTPSAFVKEYLEKKHTEDILKTLRSVSKEEIKEIKYLIKTKQKDREEMIYKEQPKALPPGDESDENAQEVEQYTTNLETDKVLEKTLSDIKSALESIDKGTYGICKYCGNEIEEKRLLIRPFSSSCVECKKKLQQS
ncbi:MAG: DnaA N-terminal domain-containing protein [Patescibacteria group bacterium]|nr:MAG: DnaA N-terminal domain-containing protein [Patescibacteria group bacterium]